MTMPPNQAAAVDAPVVSLFGIVRHLRRATAQQRSEDNER
jgi:hypothetical protein